MCKVTHMDNLVPRPFLVGGEEGSWNQTNVWIFVVKCHAVLPLISLISQSSSPPPPPNTHTQPLPQHPPHTHTHTHTLPYFQSTYTHSQFLDSNKSRSSFVSSQAPPTSAPPITITASEVGQNLFLAKELKKAFVSLQQEKVTH